ncbi:caffeine-induced death protein 2-domain-containing protein [Scheffersomyces coipomensis]|uniref:caffeine-induced death protein 2-domain-containing protein n=1 Tax=Scheffersomyces coipomensis TaxID=1788519 RepID=UPI00315C66F9
MQKTTTIYGLFKENHPMSDRESVLPQELLSVESCNSSTRIRAFLRLSRIATDDTIRQHLNSIKTNKECDEYFQKKIVPQWKARTDVIEFCSNYVTRLRLETEQEIERRGHPNEIANTDFNLRQDPYALKNYKQKIDDQFAQCDRIQLWVNNESSIESIIREETAYVFNDKCYFKDWYRAYLDSARK